MSESLRATNLRIIKYLQGSVEIAWDDVSNLSNLLFYKVKALNISTGLWDEFTNTKSNTAAIFGDYSAVKIEAVFYSSVGPESDILAIALKNASDIHTPVLVGRDESGQARFIATTPEGIVKVTGATVTNTGGDASAANQVTQINATNTGNSTLSSILSELAVILAKLSSVGLSAASISALQSTSVNNFPSNYPDNATSAKLDSLLSLVASDANLQSLLLELSKKVNKTDLSLDGAGRVNSNIVNFPSDYPDSNAAAQLLAISNTLTDLLSTSNSSAIDLDVVSTNAVDANTTLSQILAAAQSLQLLAQNIDTLTSGLLTNSDEADEKLSTLVSGVLSLIDNTAGLLKISNLNINSGVLETSVANFPSDYPSATANSILNSVNNQLLLINQGLGVQLQNAIPTGNNKIGIVSVDAVPLASNAATESSLLELKNMVNAIGALVTVIKSNSDDIKLQATISNNFLNKLSSDRAMILTQDVSLVDTASTRVRLLDFFDAGTLSLLSTYKKYTAKIISYGLPVKIVIDEETSYEQTNFYHKIAELSLNTQECKFFEFNTPIQNVSFYITKLLSGSLVTNTAFAVRIVIYGSY